MNYGTLVIVCYFIQIPLSVYALFFMPRRGQLAKPLENVRRNTAIIGLLPCAFGSIIIQLAGIGIYYARVKAIQAKENGISNSWDPSNAPTSGVNPFGGSSQGMSSQQPPSVNPFATGDNGQPAQPAAPNPFDEGAGGAGSQPPRNNPFV